MNRILLTRATTRVVAGVVAVAALTAVTTAPAMAASTESSYSAEKSADPARTLEVIQAEAAAKTAQRIASLTRAITRVNANTYLTDSDRAAILATLNADVAGMHSLAATIAADTDRATAAAHYAQIFTDYRVYAVAIPQSFYAAAADGLTGTVIPKLIEVHQKLSDALANSDKSTPELEATLADMQTQIDAAQAAISGVAAAALAVTPADYNANHAVLASSHASVVAAHAAARLARADAKTIVQALK
jgi:hypothetical protein